MIRKNILEIANDFIGQKEIAGNQGFLDKKFEGEMQSIGFEKGNSWCGYLVELVLTKGYQLLNNIDLKLEVRKLFSANAVQTYNRLVNAGWTKTTKPTPGDMVFWIKYKNGVPVKLAPEYFAGHTGIVSDVSDKNFKSIEGNTNSKGEREGIEVAEKTRTYNWTSNSGLRLLGFIQPKEA